MLNKFLLSSSKTEPQKPDCLQRLDTSLNEIKTFLPALQKESLEREKALSEFLELPIEQIHLQISRQSTGSTANDKGILEIIDIDSLESIRDSLDSQSTEGFAENHLREFETKKQEFVRLMEEARVYMHNLEDIGKVHVAYYSYLVKRMSLEHLKGQLDEIKNTVIGNDHGKSLPPIQQIKTWARNIQPAELIEAPLPDLIQEVINRRHNELLYQNVASWFEKSNAFNESLLQKILGQADQMEAQLLESHALPTPEQTSHPLESLTETKVEANLLEFSSSSTLQTAVDVFTEIKSGVQTSSPDKKRISWSHSEAETSTQSYLTQSLNSPLAVSTSAEKKGVKKPKTLSPSRSICLNPLNEKPLASLTARNIGEMELIPGTLISVLVFVYLVIVQITTSMSKQRDGIKNSILEFNIHYSQSDGQPTEYEIS